MPTGLRVLLSGRDVIRALSHVYVIVCVEIFFRSVPLQHHYHVMAWGKKERLVGWVGGRAG